MNSMAAFSSSFQLLQHYSSSSPSTPINFDHPNNALFSNNDPSICDLFGATNKNSMDNSSSVVTDHHNYKKYRESSVNPIAASIHNRKRKSSNNHSSHINSAQSKDMREVKGKKQKKVKGDCEEKKGGKELAPTGYIHVRARRGQATDSHSLAERVRRERISERMKLLQALVPGCDKVTGKALMLDEIINYVQSLQNQVEFLSMKLASVNPMLYDFGMDLESLMVIRPDHQSLSSLPSPFPEGMQECVNPNTTSINAYPVLDNSANSLLLQQSQLPYALTGQGERQVLWEVDEQRQKINNQSAINNTFFSFPLM